MQGLGIFPIIAMFAVFYFFLIMPEKKKQKQMQEMLGAVKVGDKILTRGGIKGEVVAVEEDGIILQTGPDNVRLSMAKIAIGQVLEKANTAGYTEVDDVKEIEEAKEVAAEEIEEKNE